MSQADPKTQVEPKRAPGWLRRSELVFGVLVALSIVGIGVTDFSRSEGLTYWLAMVPAFAAASIWSGWASAAGSAAPTARFIGNQLLHWGALGLAVYLVYLLQRFGRLNAEGAGLVALLALALTTFLAGVHYSWRLCVIGLVLGSTVAAAALVEEFFWLLLIPALIAGGVVVFWRRLPGRE